MGDRCPKCGGTDICATVPIMGSPSTGNDMLCLDCEFEWKAGGKHDH